MWEWLRFKVGAEVLAEHIGVGMWWHGQERGAGLLNGRMWRKYGRAMGGVGKICCFRKPMDVQYLTGLIQNPLKSMETLNSLSFESGPVGARCY